jgi:wyosine [tRNA(Phe)-imidazoG37] synthetase (radical SAM superfamily)
MSTVFGPVPSRRLGRSLGIDPVPLKTCNWNCIYCQLGRSCPLTTERREYNSVEVVLRDLDRALVSHPPDSIDWITFVGSGEPLLHASIGELINGVRNRTELPVAVITNGSLLYFSEVRRDLLTVQAVLPTVDAGSESLYRRINRPHPEASFQRHIWGLEAFRTDYRGRLLVEVMLVRGVNDTEPALHDIASVLRRIQPDEIHLMLPTRPPVEPWVVPADRTGVQRAEAILGEVGVVQSEHYSGSAFSRSSSAPEADELVGIIQRHPMSDEELRRTVQAWAPGRVEEVLKQLMDSDRVRTVVREDRLFWVPSSSHFPDSGERIAGRGNEGNEPEEETRDE